MTKPDVDEDDDDPTAYIVAEVGRPIRARRNNAPIEKPSVNLAPHKESLRTLFAKRSGPSGSPKTSWSRDWRDTNESWKTTYPTSPKTSAPNTTTAILEMMVCQPSLSGRLTTISFTEKDAENRAPTKLAKVARLPSTCTGSTRW